MLAGVAGMIYGSQQWNISRHHKWFILIMVSMALILFGGYFFNIDVQEYFGVEKVLEY